MSKGLEAMTADRPHGVVHAWGSDYGTLTAEVWSGPKSCIGRHVFVRFTREEAAELGQRLLDLAANKESWPDPFGNIVHGVPNAYSSGVA